MIKMIQKKKSTFINADATDPDFLKKIGVGKSVNTIIAQMKMMLQIYQLF